MPCVAFQNTFGVPDFVIQLAAHQRTAGQPRPTLLQACQCFAHAHWPVGCCFQGNRKPRKEPLRPFNTYTHIIRVCQGLTTFAKCCCATEESANKVRLLNFTTGSISTYAGTGAAGSSGMAAPKHPRVAHSAPNLGHLEAFAWGDAVWPGGFYPAHSCCCVLCSAMPANYTRQVLYVSTSQTARMLT